MYCQCPPQKHNVQCKVTPTITFNSSNTRQAVKIVYHEYQYLIYFPPCATLMILSLEFLLDEVLNEIILIIKKPQKRTGRIFTCFQSELRFFCQSKDLCGGSGDYRSGDPAEYQPRRIDKKYLDLLVYFTYTHCWCVTGALIILVCPEKEEENCVGYSFISENKGNNATLYINSNLSPFSLLVSK